MFIWIILAALTATVLYFLLRPLAARDQRVPSSEAFDAAVYRDQLVEIENDRARGLIGEEEAEAARIEVARRLLAVDSQAGAEAQKKLRTGRAKAAMVAIGGVLPLLALGLYLVYGSPRLPDQPLAARLQDPASEQNLGALVARVEARLREHPEEGEGWDVIAPVYFSWRRYNDAADAYAQAIRLLGPSARRLSGQGQALVLANNGVVTEEARDSLEQALKLDPTLIEPRILLAIAKEQDGNYQGAIADWRSLLERAGASAPWREMVQKRIAEAETHLGKVESGSPELGEADRSGQNQRTMPPADSAEMRAMVEQMVQNLAAKLDQNGDDLAGWLRLVRSYSVLGRKDEALKALERAKSQFRDDAQALGELDRLAGELGLKS